MFTTRDKNVHKHRVHTLLYVIEPRAVILKHFYILPAAKIGRFGFFDQVRGLFRAVHDVCYKNSFATD
jgi:hypothetical protein